MKRCKDCGVVKPLTDFYRSPGMKDGHRNDCKTCNLAAKAARYRADPQREIDRVKRWQRENKAKYRAKQRKWRAANRDREREGHLRRKFGITQADYQAMLEAQGGGCAICGRPPKEGVALHVDHDHETGEVRGLLCVSCNQGLGQFGDDPALLHAAVEYVEGGAAALIEAAELSERAHERAGSLASRGGL